MQKNIEQLEKIIKEQQEFIDKSSKRNQAIFEHSRVGMVFVNSDGYFIDVNKKFCDMVGYSYEELLSLTFQDITYNSDLERDLGLNTNSKRDGTNSFTLEKRYIRKDGKVIWVEIFINHIKDEDGKFLYSLGFITDITKRKRIQDTILEQTKTMQLYLDIVDVMIVAINRQGNITLVNRKTCEVLGFDEHHILGKNWFNKFVSNKDKDRSINDYIKTINKEIDIVDRVQYKVKCKDTTNRMILWRRAYIYDDEKNIIGVISSGEDITEILKLEAENKRSEQALFNQSKMASMGEMIRNIAHQWRQPLSTISTAASGIKIQKEMGVLKDSDFNKSMTAIVDTTQYLSQTIDDFQNFFKMDNYIKEFTCEDLFSNIKNLVVTNYKAYEIDLIIENNSICTLKGPYNEIIQVIINILNNSKDAFLESSLNNKVVSIHVSFIDNSLLLTIKDNAGGIPENLINRVFEPYFTTKHQSLGTGIGLYMVKDIVENRLEGTVEVINEEVEYKGVKRKGAVFKLAIPNVQ